MQVFNVEIQDQSIQAVVPTQTISTQTYITSDLLASLRDEDDEDSLRRKIDLLADGLGSQRSLINQLFQKSKSTESSVLSESSIIRKQGPPPPYEASPSRWPKFLSINSDQVLNTGWTTFILWSLILFLLGLTSQSLIVPKHSLSGLFPDRGYVSAFEVFGQRHWWEKWDLDSPVGKMVWRFGWWCDEMLRGDGGWPS
jgi:hypothetical protein